jgi:putative addiction module component (TIGR02574 family)
MSHIEKLLLEIQNLTAEDKLRVLDAILTSLNDLTSDVDRVWALEASKRWARYKAGHLRTVSYEEMMAKYKV